jgi:hypothetical protein
MCSVGRRLEYIGWTVGVQRSQTLPAVAPCLVSKAGRIAIEERRVRPPGAIMGQRSADLRISTTMHARPLSGEGSQIAF